MGTRSHTYVYGPVPSRRLGRSLGIDLVPHKTCSYDCIYCQLGPTTVKTLERDAYGDVDDMVQEVQRRLNSCASPPDYIGIAGSGEPTLNSHVGRLIEKVKTITSVPVAVLTNGSLLWMPEVRDDLMRADVVLPSLDAGDGPSFERVNRPHPDLSFAEMVEGIASFTGSFAGEVWLEVLLVADVTGVLEEAAKIATLAEYIAPTRIQLNTVCRPPTERSALAVADADMRALKALFPGEVDIISHDPGISTAALPTEGPSDDEIMTLLQRRPCTASDVADGLGMHINDAIKRLDMLVTTARVTTTVMDDRTFFTVPGNPG